MSLYTKKELDQFMRYTGLLVDLCNKDFGGFDGVTVGSRKCPQCARSIPAGVPRQVLDTDWVACPACVHRRHLAGGLERHVFGEGAHGKPRLDEAVAIMNQAVANVVKKRIATLPVAKSDRLANLAATMEERLKTTEGDKRAETEKLLLVIKKALSAARGETP